ncbi:universal stress protein [Pseudonocardia xishanensis]|uniref:UspA domain-containing protein n=1 Tax=Pseudonocardia xishanensis TaxID=630995 RepID=A0ABP8RUM5_9PSEU
MSEIRPVVVGVDGSGVASAAVRVAAVEAVARGCPLQVVHTVGDGEPPEQTERILARAVGIARDVDPALEIRTRTAAWSPAVALAAASREARLLVVGMAGRDDPPEAADRSVALDLLRRAHCPLVVVRARHRRHRAVVLALLTGTGDADVLAVGADLAAGHGTTLVVERWGEARTDPVDAVGLAHRVRPEVEVSVHDLGTPTFGGLLDHAEGAVALVLAGPAGPARFDDPARVAVHRGPCPVVVVPQGAPLDAALGAS